ATFEQDLFRLLKPKFPFGINAKYMAYTKDRPVKLAEYLLFLEDEYGVRNFNNLNDAPEYGERPTRTNGYGRPHFGSRGFHCQRGNRTRGFNYHYRNMGFRGGRDDAAHVHAIESNAPPYTRGQPSGSRPRSFGNR